MTNFPENAKMHICGAFQFGTIYLIIKHKEPLKVN